MKSRLPEPLFIYLRVQGNPISLTVEHDGAKPVRSDRVNRKDDFASMRGGLGNSILNPSVNIEIDQYPTIGGDLISPGNQATTIAFFVLQHGKVHILKGLFLNIDPEDFGVEFNRSIQVFDGNVEPDANVMLAIEVTHVFPSLEPPPIAFNA